MALIPALFQLLVGCSVGIKSFYYPSVRSHTEKASKVDTPLLKSCLFDLSLSLGCIDIHVVSL